MPENVLGRPSVELSRLERMGDPVARGGMIRNYLDWLSRSRGAASAPRSGSTRSTSARCSIRITRASRTSRAGIVEYIAVEKLRKERGVADDSAPGAILTLIGPPGTGKTWIGEWIARATGREFGLQHVARWDPRRGRIRGHRRHCIGARPRTGLVPRSARRGRAMKPR